MRDHPNVRTVQDALIAVDAVNGSGQPSEIRILPDGTIYVHNLTRAVAEVLQALAPHDQTFANRVTAAIPKQTKPSATAADPDRIEHELPNRT